jgi:hypothetical protein
MKYRKLGNTGLIVSEVAAHVHFAAELHRAKRYRTLRIARRPSPLGGQRA